MGFYNRTFLIILLDNSHSDKLYPAVQMTVMRLTFPVAIITILIFTMGEHPLHDNNGLITTPLNYRMPVPVRSDFRAYTVFPEVYHAHEISKVAIPPARKAPSSRVREPDKSPSHLEYRARSRFVSRKLPSVKGQIRNQGFSELKKNTGTKRTQSHTFCMKVCFAVFIASYFQDRVESTKIHFRSKR